MLMAFLPRIEGLEVFEHRVERGRARQRALGLDVAELGAALILDDEPQLGPPLDHRQDGRPCGGPIAEALRGTDRIA
jgi:hypothetical protein